MPAWWPRLTGSRQPLTASLSQQLDLTGVRDQRAFTASIVGNISIPIYQGGAEYATTRQAKESLSQQELQTESQRNQVRAAVVASWGANQASVGVVRAARAAVAANEVALAGVREEAKVGQRTTLDVLNAQQALLNAQVSQVQAQHDKVVAAYTLLGALGGLDAETLKLRVHIYDPAEHYELVKDKWFGLRTPDGR